MTITLKSLNKHRTAAIYALPKGTVRFALSTFEGKIAPGSLEIVGPFAALREPRVKLTADERKAARAAKPKPTLAEKVAKAEERAAKMRAKLQEQTVSM